MNKNLKLLWLSGIILLGGCGFSQGEEELSSVEVETEESISETETVSNVESIPEFEQTTLAVFDDLVEEEDFSNQHGYQAWLDYKTISEEYVIADIFNESSPGTSSAEIDAFFGEDIERAEVELLENEKMVFYRYPDEPGGAYSEISSFLAEIAFYFADDKLVFSSVTPGFYQMSPTEFPEMERLGNLYTVEELAALNPQVFTIAEMNVNGRQLRQVMVGAQPGAEQTDAMANAFYMFVLGDEIIHHATISFMEVSQDFPSSSVRLYNSYFQWLNEQ